MLRKIDQEILRLAIPNMISNISVPLLSTVDVVLMGSMSIDHLAAIGIGGMLFNLIYWNLGFLRMGTTGMIAQAYGADDSLGISKTLSKALVVAVVLSFIVLIGQNIWLELGNSFFGSSGMTKTLMGEYYSVRIWAAPATLVIYVLTGMLFGMQNSLVPLLITVCVNVVNIVLSYFLVVVLNHGIYGVALGTVVAQYVGAALLGLIITKKYGAGIRLDVWSVFENPTAFVGFLRINADIFLRTVCLTFVFSFFYSLSVSLGTIVVAVNVILQQFINWMSYIIDGFAFAAESLVGRFKGASDQGKLQLVIRQTLLWSGISAFLFAAIFYLFDIELVQLFSDDLIAIAASKPLMIYVWIFPIIAFGSYIWDGIFIGLLATKSMRNSMVASLLLFFAALTLLPQYPNGEHIWIALSVFVLARGVIQSLMYTRYGTALN